MNSLLAAFVSGLLFAVGLGISGMTQPAKVTAFLDFTGNWDPSLACVMIGAITVHAVLYRVIRRRSSPLFASAFSVPTRQDIDLRLVGGAALFGVGWGLGGFCPGPAVTSLASGHASVVLFAAAMIAGMYLYKLLENSRLHHLPISSQDAASHLATPPSPLLQSSQDY
jgi:hypothetical protein